MDNNWQYDYSNGYAQPQYTQPSPDPSMGGPSRQTSSRRKSARAPKRRWRPLHWCWCARWQALAAACWALH